MSHKLRRLEEEKKPSVTVINTTITQADMNANILNISIASTLMDDLIIKYGAWPS